MMGVTYASRCKYFGSETKRKRHQKSKARVFGGLKNMCPQEKTAVSEAPLKVKSKNFSL